MITMSLGEDNLVRLSSSIVDPWDKSKFTIDIEDVYLGFDKSSIGVFEIPAKYWDLYSSQYKVVEHPLLSSDTTVIFVSIDDAYYNLFHDLVPLIYKMFKTDPDVFFLLHNPHRGYGSLESNTKESRDLAIKYIGEFLTYLGVKHIIHDTWEENIAIRVNKRLKLDKNKDIAILTLGDVKQSMRAMREYTLTEDEINATPHRKVYLSRTHLKNVRDYDLRVHNEEVLEEYFRARGYEVIIPEKTFSSFDDQIRYFNQVRVLAGVTGSGLANGFLMQEHQYVLDIATELGFPPTSPYIKPRMIQNEHYVRNSYINNQYHIIVPSRDDPHDVCKKLDAMEDIISRNFI